MSIEKSISIRVPSTLWVVDIRMRAFDGKQFTHSIVDFGITQIILSKIQCVDITLRVTCKCFDTLVKRVFAEHVPVNAFVYVFEFGI